MRWENGFWVKKDIILAVVLTTIPCKPTTLVLRPTYNNFNYPNDLTKSVLDTIFISHRLDI